MLQIDWPGYVLAVLEALERMVPTAIGSKGQILERIQSCICAA